MKHFKLNKFAVAAIAAVSVMSMTKVANACSRMTLDTPHGVTTVRSLDWGDQLGNVTQVNPVGIQNVSETPSYKNAMTWTTKYHAVAQMEWDVFGGVASDGINSEGLGASLLYLYDSQEFIKDYKDTGAPALSFLDVIRYITETYATTEEAVNAFNNNEWQIAWADGLHGAQHGLHISIQDKSGDIALLQLNEGGKMVVHRGDVASDLRVMANAPLQQYHRDYVAKVDLTDLEAKNIPTSISSLDRNLRGLFHTTHVKLDDKTKSWAQTRGKLLSTFNSGNLVLQDLTDPVNGETYASWTQFVYNHVNGDFLFTNYDTRASIGYNFSDTTGFTETMCADTVKQAEEGLSKPVFSACESNHF
ncbi:MULTISPECIES: linear amide C-N hydrolase [unclassified Agarivorans]|uniref:linear amide C-N hydrolase n=1 Tax=unclassified Agarivorans TaxID=2636026 RepID=UPI0026E1EDA6|nr:MULTISPECIES: linear amide C-N hydrolase [unclassified Agarivorans]MDO6684459.1 linear amide C-N hydrolase [Agarivorans sp. 3_MG-2023]MDO6714624.1 linear amide C-N hydrolase [Agarivorans sp. 2_MG-2023]